MRRLTVLYDANCGLCRRARVWLESEPVFVPLEFLVAGSQEARERYPGLAPEESLAELCVVADDGRLWQGAGAWVMCLWALRRYRSWALTIARPGRFGLARRFVATVSRHRISLSEWLPPSREHA